MVTFLTRSLTNTGLSSTSAELLLGIVAGLCKSNQKLHAIQNSHRDLNYFETIHNIERSAMCNRAGPQSPTECSFGKPLSWFEDSVEHVSGKKIKRKKARNGKQMASVLGLSVLLCSLAFFSVSLANVVDLDDSNFDSVSVPPCAHGMRRLARRTFQLTAVWINSFYMILKVTKWLHFRTLYLIFAKWSHVKLFAGLLEATSSSRFLSWHVYIYVIIELFVQFSAWAISFVHQVVNGDKFVLVEFYAPCK